jgi:hypothetical protein
LARPNIVEIKEPKGKKTSLRGFVRSPADREKRRDRFERELCLYSIETYTEPRLARALGKPVIDQPPYMPELRALYMAVRKTHKGGIGDLDHMWPRVIGASQ